MAEKFKPLIRHHKNGTLTIAGRSFREIEIVKRIEVIDAGEFSWYCAKCLNEIDGADEFCRKCGAELNGYERRRGTRSRK